MFFVAATAATWLNAQSSTSTGQSDRQERLNRNLNEQQNQASTDNSSTNDVMKINRCSQLIGMEVKNQQGDKLGKINDVVIDFSNGRVAYVVLNSSTSPFTADKLHAVPLRAFQPASDGKSVVLNADKEKLANAQGFAKDEWPSATNPSWGAEPFWQENTGGQQQQQQEK